MRLLTVITGLILASPLFAENLFRYGSKDYKAKDLSPAIQQQLYDAEMRFYQQRESIINQSVLDLYFEELAKKKKKSKEEIEVDELRMKPVTDSEVRKFYNENKSKIPPGYTFEQVKPEIKKILIGQNQQKSRQDYLGKVKTRKGVKISMRKPVAPTVDIKTDGFQIKGKKGSKVKIIEFADYQCPHCGHAFQAFKKLMKTYSKKVEFVFIDFPINRSGISKVVAEGAYCASKQNKYWEFHDMAFSKQASLTKKSPEEFAKKLKLDGKKFKTCLNSAEAKSYVAKGRDEGNRVGVSGTPAVFINGKRFTKSHKYEDLKAEIDKLL